MPDPDLRATDSDPDYVRAFAAGATHLAGEVTAALDRWAVTARVQRGLVSANAYTRAGQLVRTLAARVEGVVDRDADAFLDLLDRMHAEAEHAAYMQHLARVQADTPGVPVCPECGLPDRAGFGDGLTSCGCPPGCQRCQVRPGEDCLCEHDEDGGVGVEV
jgi:hypothetical protein